MPRLYIQYQNYSAVPLFTQNLPIPQGEEPIVSDLISAFQALPHSPISAFTGEITLHVAVDAPRIPGNTPLASFQLPFGSFEQPLFIKGKLPIHPLTLLLVESLTATSSVDSPLLGQVISVSIDQNKLIKKYLTPVGSTTTTPTETPTTPTDLSLLGLQLDQLLFCKNTTFRPCIVVDVQPSPLVELLGEQPTITIVLITGFAGKPLNEVMAEEDFKRVMPIRPTPAHPETAPPINTSPEWLTDTSTKRRVPSYVLCIPIKVYAHNLKRFDESVRLDPENLEKLKLHLLFLGKVVANADFVDLEEEDDEDDGLEVDWENRNRIVRWDEISV